MRFLKALAYKNQPPKRDLCFSLGRKTDNQRDIQLNPNTLLLAQQNKGQPFKQLVLTAGFEPATFGSGNRHSIQLSYASKMPSIRRHLNINKGTF
jgi:hypothetical protein